MRRHGLIVSADEFALGLGVCLPVVAVSLGERALHGDVFAGEDGVGAQAVTEAQAALQLSLLVHDVQVMGAMRRVGVAEKASVCERRVEGSGELVARA